MTTTTALMRAAALAPAAAVLAACGSFVSGRSDGSATAGAGEPRVGGTVTIVQHKFTGDTTLPTHDLDAALEALLTASDVDARRPVHWAFA